MFWPTPVVSIQGNLKLCNDILSIKSHSSRHAIALSKESGTVNVTSSTIKIVDTVLPEL